MRRLLGLLAAATLLVGATGPGTAAAKPRPKRAVPRLERQLCELVAQGEPDIQTAIVTKEQSAPLLRAMTESPWDLATVDSNLLRTLAPGDRLSDALKAVDTEITAIDEPTSATGRAHPDQAVTDLPAYLSTVNAICIRHRYATVRVGRYVGMPVATAELALALAGFGESTNVVSGGSGRVVAQSPAVGTRVLKYSTVTLSVSENAS
jgi:hypothetical protein